MFEAAEQLKLVGFLALLQDIDRSSPRSCVKGVIDLTARQEEWPCCQFQCYTYGWSGTAHFPDSRNVPPLGKQGAQKLQLSRCRQPADHKYRARQSSILGKVSGSEVQARTD